jgi:hypothetical protein
LPSGLSIENRFFVVYHNRNGFLCDPSGMGLAIVSPCVVR